MMGTAGGSALAGVPGMVRRRVRDANIRASVMTMIPALALSAVTAKAAEGFTGLNIRGRPHGYR